MSEKVISSFNWLCMRRRTDFSFPSKIDITPIVGRDVGLMIRAFAAALADDNLLVQRAALDLLLQTMRLESAAVSRASPADRAILMRAATGVVLRRDLSLNRRLFTWLLGKEENSEVQVAYFRKHGLELLVETLKVRCVNTGIRFHRETHL